MREIFARFDVPIKIILLLWFIVISGFLVFDGSARRVVRTVVKEEKQPIENFDVATGVKLIETCKEECEREIKDLVAEAAATLSAKIDEIEKNQASESKTTSQTPPKTPQPKTKQTNYVPVGSSGSSTKTEWSDISGTDFYLDTTAYGRITDAKWSANIKIFQNGEAFARLFDVTHGVAVPVSEISTKNYSYTLVESGSMTLISGNNQYRVQMKSLTGYQASFDSGRIKIISEQ